MHKQRHALPWFAAALLAAVFFYCPYSATLALWLALGIACASIMWAFLARHEHRFQWLARALLCPCVWLLMDVAAPLGGLGRRVDSIVVTGATWGEFESEIQRATGYRCEVMYHAQAQLGGHRLRPLESPISVRVEPGRLADALRELSDQLGVLAVPRAVPGGSRQSLSGHFAVDGILIHAQGSPRNEAALRPNIYEEH